MADEIIPEPPGGAHSDWEAATRALHEALSRHLAELCARDVEELRRQRWAKYEGMGAWRLTP